jgi:hypothetical protein
MVIRLLLMVIRLLLVSNAIIVSVVGLLAALYVERPSGFVVAGLAWTFAAVLLGCVPLTDPYRHERQGWQREAQRSSSPPAGSTGAS